MPISELILKISTPGLGAALIALAGCDAPAAHPSLSGVWTPASTNDCGARGETLRFTGKRILYSINGARSKVGDILGVQKTDAGLELRYTARSRETPSAQPVVPMRFLFRAEGPDRMQAVAEGVDGQPLGSIQSAELRRVFDLTRCS